MTLIRIVRLFLIRLNTFFIGPYSYLSLLRPLFYCYPLARAQSLKVLVVPMPVPVPGRQKCRYRYMPAHPRLSLDVAPERSLNWAATQQQPPTIHRPSPKPDRPLVISIFTLNTIPRQTDKSSNPYRAVLAVLARLIHRHPCNASNDSIADSPSRLPCPVPSPPLSSVPPSLSITSLDRFFTTANTPRFLT